MSRPDRVLGISGWLVAAAAVVMYVTVKYDVTVREREAPTEITAVASRAENAVEKPVPVAERRYRALVAEADNASGAGVLTVEQKLEAAEREFPSDYRFTYERAKLAVYGRAEHHEAFHHLRKAAEKAIRTERAPEMLDRLEEDGRPKGVLRKLAVGHEEWNEVHEALEHADDAGLWREPASHPRVAAAHESRAGHAKEPIAALAEHRDEDAQSARHRALALLDSGQPCQALVALQPVQMDPQAREMYHHLRELCMR